MDEVLNDITRVFHHPALRDERLEIHRDMFNTVKKWVDEQPDRGSLNHILSSASVKAGHNHSGDGSKGIHDHGSLGGHGKTSGSIWSEIRSRDLGSMAGYDGNPQDSYLSSSPQPESGPPSFPSPGFGYENHGLRPGSANRPQSQGGYLNPNYGGYQGGPPPSSYQQNSGYGQEPPAFGMPPGPPVYQQPPYPVQQPQYGGPAPYPGGFDQGYQPGPPGGYPHGAPPGNWQQGESGYPGAQQPPFSGQFPPQPPYGGYQYPPGGGGGYNY